MGISTWASSMHLDTAPISSRAVLRHWSAWLVVLIAASSAASRGPNSSDAPARCSSSRARTAWTWAFSISFCSTKVSPVPGKVSSGAFLQQNREHQRQQGVENEKGRASVIRNPHLQPEPPILWFSSRTHLLHFAALVAAGHQPCALFHLHHPVEKVGSTAQSMKQIRPIYHYPKLPSPSPEPAPLKHSL